jgi:hypothetical protein
MLGAVEPNRQLRLPQLLPDFTVMKAGQGPSLVISKLKLRTWQSPAARALDEMTANSAVSARSDLVSNAAPCCKIKYGMPATISSPCGDDEPDAQFTADSILPPQ